MQSVSIIQMAGMALPDAPARPDGEQQAAAGEEAGLGGLDINGHGGPPALQPQPPAVGSYGAAPPPQQRGASGNAPSFNRPPPYQPQFGGPPAAAPPPDLPSPPSDQPGGAYQAPHLPPPPSGV